METTGQHKLLYLSGVLVFPSEHLLLATVYQSGSSGHLFLTQKEYPEINRYAHSKKKKKKIKITCSKLFQNIMGCCIAEMHFNSF